MFSKTIIDSDLFLNMPLSAQALYFHLSMRADDDGFVNNPRKIQRITGCAEDDMRLLIAKQFIICFESGIVVIKHWKIHNYIRSDRYKPTMYQAEYNRLSEGENKEYIDTGMTLGIPNDNQMSYQRETQVRLGKVSLGKGRQGEVRDTGVVGGEGINPDEEPVIITPSADTPGSPAPSSPVRHKYGQYNNVLLSDSDMEKLKAEFPEDFENRIERLSEYIASTGKKYKNHLATIRNWARRDGKGGKQGAKHGGYGGGNHGAIEESGAYGEFL